jgi:hypothetical protein
LELKRQQDEEARKMNKFRIFVEKKKNLIAELSSKILEEEDKDLLELVHKGFLYLN